MTVREFYLAIGGDYAAALAVMHSDDRILERLRRFPNEEDYARLLPALQEKRWDDAMTCAAGLRAAARDMMCPALYQTCDALYNALAGIDPQSKVPQLQEKLARDYRVVVAAVNGTMA